MLMKHNHLKTPTILILSFALIILIGSLLLSLPLAQLPSSQASYIDHLFNAVSASCVTGLFIESIADSYNLIGKTIMLVLIQIGGLGTMTLFALVLKFFNRRISHHQKRTMTLAFNYQSLSSLSEFIQSIISYSLFIELIGACLLSLYFIPERGWGEGIYSSLFLSISAFCNAGFDPFSNSSLIVYADHVLINLTISSLIILGGLGFGVWFNLTDNIKQSKAFGRPFNLKKLYRSLNPHTKLVVIMTAFLIAVGFFATLILEWNNPKTMASYSWDQKFLTAFFQSVTMRTAGFASMDYQLVFPSTLLVWVILMFIGGAPAGTAGGLKLTTFAVLVLFLKQMILNRSYVHFDRHTIPDPTLRMAAVLSVVYSSIFFTASFLLQIFEPHLAYIDLIFESVSALSTVGVSVGLTPNLSRASHILLMILMFVGRLGPMTLLTALFNQSPSKNNVRYTDTNILIG